jgi:intracellular septation protein
MTTEPRPQPNTLLKFAIELAPLIVFFAVNARWGIMPATIALMPVTVVALAASYALTRKVAPLPVITLVIVLVLGGLTIALNDELLIKLKPTIVSLLFAGVLFVGLALRRPLLKAVLGEMLPLTDPGWRALTIRWALFFVGLALVNEAVWRTMSTDTWVSFKVFGITTLTVVFSLSQMPVLQRYRLEGPAAGS